MASTNSNNHPPFIPMCLPVYFMGFIHSDKQSKSDGYNSVDEPIELEGHYGTAKTDLRPGGIAQIDDQRVDVISTGEYIRKGDTIQVARVKDGKVIVRKV